MSDTLVLCRSDLGDGGWSLHAPGSTDQDIASGDAYPIATGTSRRNRAGNWTRPNARDYSRALDAWRQDIWPDGCHQ